MAHVKTSSVSRVKNLFLFILVKFVYDKFSVTKCLNEKEVFVHDPSTSKDKY